MQFDDPNCYCKVVHIVWPFLSMHQMGQIEKQVNKDDEKNIKLHGSQNNICNVI